MKILKAIHTQKIFGRLRFWRDPDDPEVDWGHNCDGRYTPIEVKWTDSPTLADARHLRAFLSEYPTAKQAFVVCRTPRFDKKFASDLWWQTKHISRSSSNHHIFPN